MEMICCCISVGPSADVIDTLSLFYLHLNDVLLLFYPDVDDALFKMYVSCFLWPVESSGRAPDDTTDDENSVFGQKLPTTRSTSKAASSSKTGAEVKTFRILYGDRLIIISLLYEENKCVPKELMFVRICNVYMNRTTIYTKQTKGL